MYLGNKLQKYVKCPLFCLLIHSCSGYPPHQKLAWSYLSIPHLFPSDRPIKVDFTGKGEYLIQICLSVLSFHTLFKNVTKYDPKGREMSNNSICYSWRWCFIDIIILSIAKKNLMPCYLSGLLLCVVHNRHSVNAC